MLPTELSSFLDRVGERNETRAGSGVYCTIGEVKLTAGSVGIGVPAAGQIVPIGPYSALFSLIGTEFGGNGQTTFALPDLRGLAPNGTAYTICVEGLYPSPD